MYRTPGLSQSHRGARPLMWQGRVYRTPPKQPDSCPRRGLGSGAMASWLLGAILMIFTLGRTSNQGCLLPRRAHALDGAGQQTTARRHRGLLPDREPTVGAHGPGQHSQLSPSAVTLLGSRIYPPSASTGKGRRAERRSVSDPGPEYPAAEPCPRRDRPVPSAGPGATIRHRVLTGRRSFLLF